VPEAQLAGTVKEDWVDRGRRPYLSGGMAYVPVRDGYPCSLVIPPRRPYHGRAYSMIGPIAVFHGRRRPDADEIGALLAWKKPSGVIWVRSCTGAGRIPDAEVLAGSAGEVVHRECGITYRLDPARIMFSAGNRREKDRVAALVEPGEAVADMFAGIGYFTLPVARSGGRVHAMEINPDAFAYLRQNARDNHLEDRIEPALGDCRNLLRGPYNRILMGHFDSPAFLPAAIAHAAPGATIHVHSAGEAGARIRGCLGSLGIRAGLEIRKVKKLGPHTWHYVQDVTLP